MGKVTNWRTDPKMQALKAICQEHGYEGVVALGFTPQGQVAMFSYGVDGPWCKALGKVGDDILAGIGTGRVLTKPLDAVL